jgi:hypothetical protein
VNRSKSDCVISEVLIRVAVFETYGFPLLSQRAFREKKKEFHAKLAKDAKEENAFDQQHKIGHRS